MNVTDLKTSYVDRPEVGETFADALRSAVCRDGVMRVDLCVLRLDDPIVGRPQTGKMYPAIRLAMPISTAIALRDLLSQNLTELEKQGVLKPIVAQSPAAPKH
jgi:hypothetical protein